jgi:GGDEF-like domain
VIFASEVAKPRSSRSATGWAGDRDVVAATKHGQIVALTPADTDVPGRRTGSKTLGELLLGELERRGPWRATVGRPYPGSYGIARS